MGPTRRTEDEKRFIELAANAGWLNVDAIVGELDAGGFWRETDMADVLRAWKLDQARRFMRSIKNPNGTRLFQSVEHTNADGETERVYKQTSLFDVNDFEQAINGHLKLSRHHRNEALRLHEECEARLGVTLHIEQLWLPFEAGTTADIYDDDD